MKKELIWQKKKDTKKKKSYSFRTTNEESKKIDKKIEESGLSISAYMVKACLGPQIISMPHIKEALSIIHEVRNILQKQIPESSMAKEIEITLGIIQNELYKSLCLFQQDR